MYHRKNDVHTVKVSGGKAVDYLGYGKAFLYRLS